MSPKHISATAQVVSDRSLMPRPRFDPRPINVRFVTDWVTLGHVCVRVLQFILTVPSYQFSIYRRRYTIRVAGLTNFGRSNFKRHLRKQPCNNKMELLSLMWWLLISVIELQQVRLLVMSPLSLHAFHDQPRVHWYCLNIVLICKLCETRRITPCYITVAVNRAVKQNISLSNFLETLTTNSSSNEMHCKQTRQQVISVRTSITVQLQI
jgi:hypothetical protein